MIETLETIENKPDVFRWFIRWYVSPFCLTAAKHALTGVRVTRKASGCQTMSPGAASPRGMLLTVPVYNVGPACIAEYF